MIAALCGGYHLTELAGAGLVMSMIPAAQLWFVEEDHAREERIEKEIPADLIERLSIVPEFVKAYEPDGLKPCDFISYGAAQRTLCQYIELGWRLLENL
jgi:transaldolase